MKVRAGSVQEQARQIRAAAWKHGYATLIRDGDYRLLIVPGPAEVVATYGPGVVLEHIIEDIKS
jgi:hypothetical protein